MEYALNESFETVFEWNDIVETKIIFYFYRVMQNRFKIFCLK